MHTPTGSVHLPTAGSTPVSVSHAAPHAAGDLEPPLSAALPETLDAALKSLQTSFHDGSSIPPETPSDDQSTELNKSGPTTAGLPETPFSDFGQQHSSHVELSGFVTKSGAAFSLPGISSALSMPPLHKRSSPVGLREADIQLGAVPRSIPPTLPSPQLSHSWPPTTGSCAQLKLPADAAGAAGADNPALQVRSCCLIGSVIAQHDCRSHCHTLCMACTHGPVNGLKLTACTICTCWFTVDRTSDLGA